jgi:hypothetical protein
LTVPAAPSTPPACLFRIVHARGAILNEEEEEEEEFIQNRTLEEEEEEEINLIIEEEEEEFITRGHWRGKHNSLSRGAGADPP